MKHIITTILSLIGICRIKQNQKNVIAINHVIDVIVQTTPLIRPILCLSFSREYCDSIRHERKVRLENWAKEAKSIKNKKVSLAYFMLKVSELDIDVSKDYERALTNSLRCY